MISKETFKLASDFKVKLEAYAEQNDRVDSSFYAAINAITALMERANTDYDIERKFKKWLISKSTLDLKKIVPSEGLHDFNVMSYLDTVSIIKIIDK
jgi:hypothetical protein